MPFGQVVIGPPGSGKSIYCYGMYQLLKALDRPVRIINLDPFQLPTPPTSSAPPTSDQESKTSLPPLADQTPYPASLSLSSLISLADAMEPPIGLGPNGAMLYCLEYLESEEGWEWFREGIEGLAAWDDGRSGRRKDDGTPGGMDEDLYLIFDTPGQTELSTNHGSLKRILKRLEKELGIRLAVIHLVDSQYITTAAKFVSILLLSLRTMLQLELPHLNVLSKIDLIGTYGDLPFNLDFYTQVQDLHYLETELDKDPRTRKYGELNKLVCELVEDFGLVGFETLAIEDKKSILSLLEKIDQTLGYVPPPPSANSHSPTRPNAPPGYTEGDDEDSHTVTPASVRTTRPRQVDSVQDVQERYLDNRDEWQAWERKMWRDEGETLRGGPAGQQVPENVGDQQGGGGG